MYHAQKLTTDLSHETNVDMSASRKTRRKPKQERKVIANSLRIAYAWFVQNFTTLAPCAVCPRLGMYCRAYAGAPQKLGSKTQPRAHALREHRLDQPRGLPEQTHACNCDRADANGAATDVSQYLRIPADGGYLPTGLAGRKQCYANETRGK